jgi:uncharacterized protein (TIGR00725 family)
MPRALEWAEEVGRLIATRGGVVISGGRGGVMEAVSKGAQQAGGLTVGIMPSLDGSEANPYVDLRITTGLGGIRNILTIRTSDAVIMIAGGRGTLNELTVAYGHKPVIILEGTGGWSDRIRAAAVEEEYLDDRRDGHLRYADSPEEAVSMAFDLAAVPEKDSPSQ